LSQTQWPGRLQVLRERPLVVVDGAQNKASAAALAQAMPEWFQYDHLMLVIGISKDKDQQGILSEFSRIAHRIIVTRADHPRAISVDRLAEMVDPKKLAGRFSHIDEAIHKAQKMVSIGDLILVTGSLFVVGEAIQAMQKPFTSAQEKARKLLGF
jgi:dihydrofolate synthase/folylpolyglutamate synthase